MSNFIFKLEDFEGPLDLMLEMFKKDKLEIATTNIETVIDQYLELMEELEREDYNVAIGYLEFAAELVLYKSKKILEEDEEDEVEESLDAEELVNRILEYKKYKKVSEEISELEKNRHSYLTKDESILTSFIDQKLEGLELDIFLEHVQNAFIRISNSSTSKEEQEVEFRKELDVETMMGKLLHADYINFTKMIQTELESKEEIITSFLAILEILKREDYDYKLMGGDLIVYRIEVGE